MCKRLAIWLVIAFPLLLGAAMVWYAWPRSGYAPMPGSILVTHYPAVARKAAAVLIVYCAVALLLGGIWGAIRSRRTLLGRIALLVADLAIVAFACVIASGFLDVTYGLAFRPWDDHGAIRMPNGRTYHVLHFWETYLLAEEVGRSPLFLQTRVLGSAGEYDGTLLVRPRGDRRYAFPSNPEAPGFGKHAGRPVTDSGRRTVLYVWGDVTQTKAIPYCATSLAYDLASASFLGGEKLPLLSPFLLVGPEDALEPDDVRALLYVLGNGQQYVYVRPDIQVLVRDARHPNPKIRELVARMLSHYQYDRLVVLQTLTRLAAHDPDPNVRKAGQASLSKLKASDAKGTP